MNDISDLQTNEHVIYYMPVGPKPLRNSNAVVNTLAVSYPNCCQGFPSAATC